MSAMSSQFIGVWIVYSTVGSGADKKTTVGKHMYSEVWNNIIFLIPEISTVQRERIIIISHILYGCNNLSILH